MLGLKDYASIMHLACKEPVRYYDCRKPRALVLCFIR